ncbi:hypothetical protein RND81_09G170000 [Saponaria officinalis]|uniref:Uncharacterized protein n=1 Tax=Saponaria officinalis TaxID=3572 RepID=A0AAW1IMY2_SAPOF
MSQFLTVGFIVGGLCRRSLVELTSYSAMFYFTGVMINRDDHADDDSSMNPVLKRLLKTVKLCFESKSYLCLFPGIFIGGLFSDPGAVLILGYLLFLIGCGYCNSYRLESFINHDLDVFLGVGFVAGVLWLWSYENLVFSGYIVYWIYQNFHVRPEIPKDLAVRFTELYRANAVVAAVTIEENRRDANSRSISAHRQYNIERPARQNGDEPLHRNRSMNLSNTAVEAAGNSLQVAAGQNSNINGIQIIRDVIINNNFHFGM